MRKVFLFLGLVLSVILVWLLAPRPIPASDFWIQQSSMDTGRSEISAALVGDTVYIAGGIGFFKTLKSCEAYNIPADSWSDCPDLPLPLHHVGMASLDSEVYAAGGYSVLNFGHHEEPKLWRLNLQESAWAEIADLPSPIGEHGLFAYKGGLYVVGGRTPDGDTAAVWRYDLMSGTWADMASLPFPRHSFAAFIAEDELWVIGGRSAALGTRIVQTSIYSFEKDTWQAGPDLPLGRGGHVAAFSNGKLHVIGGEVFGPTKLVKRHDIYDPASQTWSDGPLAPAPRHGSAAIVFENEIYMFGGGARPAIATAFSASKTVQKYIDHSKGTTHE